MNASMELMHEQKMLQIVVDSDTQCVCEMHIHGISTLDVHARTFTVRIFIFINASARMHERERTYA